MSERSERNNTVPCSPQSGEQLTGAAQMACGGTRREVEEVRQ